MNNSRGSFQMFNGIRWLHWITFLRECSNEKCALVIHFHWFSQRSLILPLFIYWKQFFVAAYFLWFFSELGLKVVSNPQTSMKLLEISWYFISLSFRFYKFYLLCSPFFYLHWITCVDYVYCVDRSASEESI